MKKNRSSLNMLETRRTSRHSVVKPRTEPSFRFCVLNRTLYFCKECKMTLKGDKIERKATIKAKDCLNRRTKC